MSFFDDNHRYTLDAQRLDSEAAAMLAPLFEKYIARGYSPREIFTILTHTLFDLELEAVLDKKPAIEGSLVDAAPQLEAH